MSEKLTDSGVKSLAPPAHGNRITYDSEVKGFGCRITAAGARSFILSYRNRDGVDRRLTLGSFPDWKVAAARNYAAELKKGIDRGEDPLEERREHRDAPTVADLADRYKAEHLPKKAKQSQKDDWRMIERHILPALRNRKVADIDSVDIEALHTAITRAGTPVHANRVLAVVSKMFALALKRQAGENKPWRDQLQGNPCAGVARNQEVGHERFFSSQELAAIGDAVSEWPSTTTADCLRLIMLTGCRPGEAMSATWSQFDAQPGFWIKPAQTTKTRREHKLRLNAPALELIDSRRRARASASERSDFVFPGRNEETHLRQLRKLWDFVVDRATVRLWAESDDESVAALVATLQVSLAPSPPTVRDCLAAAAVAHVDLPEGLRGARIYDLRHTVASVGVGQLGLPLAIIGHLLGHTQSRTTQRYAHFADDPVRKATDAIGNAIAGAGKGGGEVVPIKGVR